MPVEVLVYGGVGANGGGIFGHVVGTDFTFELSNYWPLRNYNENWISQAGNGVVFTGNNTVGNDETLVFSDGSTSTVLSTDENGNFLYATSYLRELDGETVFLARTDSVSGHNSGDNVLMITDGSNAPQVLFDQLVTYYTVVGGSAYAIASDHDLYRIRSDGSYARGI
ncbi:MAG: hypothetical protein R3D29_06615 [Nitratireductor sp.]